MFPLRFRAPGHALVLRDLLARALVSPAPQRIEDALRAGQVRVDGRVARDGGQKVPPSVRVELRLESAPAGFECGWIGEAPAGSDRSTGWLALVPAPAAESGSLIDAKNAASATPFRVVARRDDVACVRVDDTSTDTARIRRMFAAAEMPVLGDAASGGILVAGGLRLWRATAPDAKPPDDAWPLEPLHAPDLASGGDAGLEVSQATLRALARGHPLVLTDGETGDAGRFAPGALVWLRPAAPSASRGAGPRARGDSKRRPGASDPSASSRSTGLLARIEGTGVVAARVWARGATRLADCAGIETRVARALERREALLASEAGRESETDAMRLIHAEADALPGLVVDRLGPCLRVVVSGRAAEPLVSRVVESLLERLGGAIGTDPPVLRVVHLRERSRGRGSALLRGAIDRRWFDAEGRLEIRERGLRFLVDPGFAEAGLVECSGARSHPAGLGIGFFVDQRENRARLARIARGGCWLNLFAHTGAFSVALLAAGAAQVTSVDLSASYLRWLDDNLRGNDLDRARHLAVRGDGRRVLETLAPEQRFHGIVLDPPTAASAGHRFWSVRRDLAPLVARALGRLVPGGTLLVTRNDRSARGRLGAEIEAIAASAGISLGSIVPARAGADFPSLDGYPEGDPFEGVFVRTAGPGVRRSGGRANVAKPAGAAKRPGGVPSRARARRPPRRR